MHQYNSLFFLKDIDKEDLLIFMINVCLLLHKLRWHGEALKNFSNLVIKRFLWFPGTEGEENDNIPSP